MWKRVLAATDLTATSHAALEVAADLARASSGTLFVVHVDALPEAAKHWLAPFYAEDVSALRGLVERRGENMRDSLVVHVREVLGRPGGLAVEPIFRWGRPAQTIVAEAERLDADVVVVGTRGTPIGSVPEGVMRAAGRPVLLVPAGTRSFIERPFEPAEDEEEGPRPAA
jgi:nucleotide-binding universal stress UspA family protein